MLDSFSTTNDDQRDGDRDASSTSSPSAWPPASPAPTSDVDAASLRPPVSAQLRQAIGNAGCSRYAIAKATHIDQATLCRFVAGGSLSLKAIDRLAEFLDLELTAGASRRKEPEIWPL